MLSVAAGLGFGVYLGLGLLLVLADVFVATAGCFVGLGRALLPSPRGS